MQYSRHVLRHLHWTMPSPHCTMYVEFNEGVHTHEKERERVRHRHTHTHTLPLDHTAPENVAQFEDLLNI